MNDAIIGRSFLTVSEAADIARCSAVTIHRAVAARRLAVVKPSGKHGRSLIRTSDLESWLARSRIAAVGE
jgi:excisionase family DNA binding protein